MGDHMVSTILLRVGTFPFERVTQSPISILPAGHPNRLLHPSVRRQIAMPRLPHRCNRPTLSAAADQYPGRKHQRAAERHLQRRGDRRRVHIFPADPADHARVRPPPRRPAPPSRSRMTGSGTATCGRCRRAWSSAPVIAPRIIGAPRPVRLPLSDSASAKPIEMPAPIEAASPTTNACQVLLRRERRGEHRRQRRDRAVHQPGQSRLDQPQHEGCAGMRVLARGGRCPAGSRSRNWSARCSCSTSASARSPSSLRIETSSLRAAARR